METNTRFVRLKQNTKRHKGRKEDLYIIFRKLQALELIKEILPIEEEDFFYDKETDTYFFIGYKVSKERFYFLKEVLL